MARKKIDPALVVAELAKLSQAEGEGADGARKALIRMANEGDQAAFAALVPKEQTKINEPLSYVSARRSLLNNLASEEKLFTRWLYEADMQKMTDELAGPNASALERLLCQRIALCHMTVHFYENLYHHNLSSMNLRVSQHAEKRMHRAHERYLNALKALAHIRKLQLPNVQVNLAEKQINVMAQK